jgi:hypothetical protein
MMVMTTEYRDEFLGTLYDPHYVNADHTGPIALTGIFMEEKLTFYASPVDAMEYGRKIYERVIAGEYGEIQEPISEPIENEAQPALPGIDK